MTEWTSLTRRDAVGVLAAGTLALAAGRALGRAAPAASHHTLWYRQPAKEWVEALPVGNGRIGAMVFGGVERERLQLNEDTLWGGGPYDPVNPEAIAALPQVRELIFAGKFAEAEQLANAKVMAKPLRQMSYQALGDLFIELVGAEGQPVTDYRRELDIDAAVATTRFVAGGVAYERRVVASPKDQVIAVEIRSEGDRPFDLALSMTSPQKAASVAVERADTLVLSGRNNGEHGIEGALRFEGRVRVLAPGAALNAEGGRVRVKGARSVTILVAMATSYRRFDDVSGDPAAITRAQIEKGEPAQLRADR
ncbi:glycoside hydrolase family 95 protein [Pedomonas mirosovicensis]|uniref:glycoside hydrolase family 95 protein n=1 Tax=Pedomonas mirosovicensis TaxID=2908641 RepID=UPI0021693DCA|nr:glycoside hydrolase family 95 protein [Pedomonas mirosovicensis]MCH8686205.1 glycoside hydrolase family 95 protein [Pedomonas mirosovicensis]